MPYEVKATPIANRSIEGLRGRARTAYEEFERVLARSGCAAFPAAIGIQRNPQGYRLTGDEPLPRLCVRHLHGADRAVVAFVGDVAWVLLVGPHQEGDRAENVYSQLYALMGVLPPSGPRTKPSCCDEGTSVAPEIDEAVIDVIIENARRLRR